MTIRYRHLRCFLAAFVALCFISGCGAGNKNKVVFVLFDLSGTTKSEKIREGYYDEFMKILGQIEGGDILFADRINDNPLGTSTYPVNADNAKFPKYSLLTDYLFTANPGDYDSNLAAVKKQTAAMVKDILKEPGSSLTKIMDSLHLAERVFHTYPAPQKWLVVMSDMVEESEHYNFKTDQLDKVKQIIEKETREGRLPDLQGVKIFVTGASKTIDQSSRNDYYKIMNFWMEYFAACKADSSKDRYGSTLTKFE